MIVKILLFSLSCLYQDNWQQVVIEEGLQFEVPSGWSYVSSVGSIDKGALQVTYTLEQGIETDTRVINPMIIVTMDKPSWFKDENDYLEQKIEFHQAMGDRQERVIRSMGEENPLQINATYIEMEFGRENSATGQKLVTATTWSKKFGLHFQLYTDPEHFTNHKEMYRKIFASIELL